MLVRVLLLAPLAATLTALVWRLVTDDSGE